MVKKLLVLSLSIGLVLPAFSEANLKPNDTVSYTAKIIMRTKSFGSPGKNFRGYIGTVSPWNRGPHQLLVLDSRRVKGRDWIKVRLGSRPNTAAAWILSGRTILRKNYWRIEIDRSQKRVQVFYRGRLKTAFSAVVGAPETPTPKGFFAIYEKVPQRPTNGFIGPYALHLTAHSNVLDNYGGGPGRVAIHGRDGASFADPLGTARSHGCVRVNNRRVLFLARNVPLGTPVLIQQ